jgi:hypothetical protein
MRVVLDRRDALPGKLELVPARNDDRRQAGDGGIAHGVSSQNGVLPQRTLTSQLKVRPVKSSVIFDANNKHMNPVTTESPTGWKPVRLEVGWAPTDVVYLARPTFLYCSLRLLPSRALVHCSRAFHPRGHRPRLQKAFHPRGLQQML